MYGSCECGRTRGTCFIARRLEVVTVAGLLWIRGVFGGGGIFLCFVCRFFLSERTRPAASMRPPLASCLRASCLIYLSTSTAVYMSANRYSVLINSIIFPIFIFVRTYLVISSSA